MQTGVSLPDQLISDNDNDSCIVAPKGQRILLCLSTLSSNGSTCVKSTKAVNMCTLLYETRMTASVLKQDPNIEKGQKSATY